MGCPGRVAVTLDPSEHLSYQWLPWREAATLTISWTNRDAILALPRQDRRRRSVSLARLRGNVPLGHAVSMVVSRRAAFVADLALAAALCAPALLRSEQPISIRTARDGEFVTVSASVLMQRGPARRLGGAVRLRPPRQVHSRHEELARRLARGQPAARRAEGRRGILLLQGAGQRAARGPRGAAVPHHARSRSRATSKGLETRYDLRVLGGGSDARTTRAASCRSSPFRRSSACRS